MLCKCRASWPIGSSVNESGIRSNTAHQFSMSSQAFLLGSTACSGGFIWLSADRCTGEAFRLISCPHTVGRRERDRKREREPLSVHMFIHSPRILSCLPTRSRLWLFPSFRPHSHTPSFVADLQVIARCCYQQLQVRWQMEVVDSDWSGARAERSPPLYRGSCLQLRDGKRILR